MAPNNQASAPNVAAQEVGRTPQTTVGLPGGGPFIRYSPTPSVQPAYVSPGIAFGGRSQLPLSAVGGFLKGLHLTFAVVGSSSTTTTAATADAPWNLIQAITIKDASGQPIYQPLDGFSLFLVQLYSGQCGSGGTQDPRVLPSFSPVVTAQGATTGQLSFKLYLPLSVNSSGYCSLPCDNSAELPKLEVFFNSAATVYTNPPTTAGSITLTVEEDFWSVPNNLQGIKPFDEGASAQWFITTSAQNPPANAYMRVLDQAVGQFIHTKIFVLRDGSNVRQDFFPPTDLSLWIDNYPYRSNETFVERQDWMAKAHAVGASSNTGSAITLANGRPAGVIVYTWRQSVATMVDDSDDLERILVTTGSTKFEVGGTWGNLTGVPQLTALTGMVFPGPSGWPYGSQSAVAA